MIYISLPALFAFFICDSLQNNVDHNHYQDDNTLDHVLPQ